MWAFNAKGVETYSPGDPALFRNPFGIEERDSQSRTAILPGHLVWEPNVSL
jgi:hypothetical protein